MQDLRLKTKKLPWFVECIPWSWPCQESCWSEYSSLRSVLSRTCLHNIEQIVALWGRKVSLWENCPLQWGNLHFSLILSKFNHQFAGLLEIIRNCTVNQIFSARILCSIFSGHHKLLIYVRICDSLKYVLGIVKPSETSPEIDALWSAASMYNVYLQKNENYGSSCKEETA